MLARWSGALVLSAWLSVLGCAQAQPSEMVNAAKTGDVAAQYELLKAYLYGNCGEKNADDALRAYDAQRRPVASEVQLANRRQAGDVMARVSALARRGAHGDAATELQDIERRYKQLAGFDVEALNHRKSWSVSAAGASAG